MLASCCFASLLLERIWSVLKNRITHTLASSNASLLSFPAIMLVCFCTSIQLCSESRNENYFLKEKHSIATVACHSLLCWPRRSLLHCWMFVWFPLPAISLHWPISQERMREKRCFSVAFNESQISVIVPAIVFVLAFLRTHSKDNADAAQSVGQFRHFVSFLLETEPNDRKFFSTWHVSLLRRASCVLFLVKSNGQDRIWSCKKSERVSINDKILSTHREDISRQCREKLNKHFIKYWQNAWRSCENTFHAFSVETSQEWYLAAILRSMPIFPSRVSAVFRRSLALESIFEFYKSADTKNENDHTNGYIESN